MIKKILIANRGEVACRIIKTAKKMGIKTVAVYSEADSTSIYVQQADEAVFIGKSPANMSYLNHKAILNAIKVTGADAVHPGYGFLSENAKFAELMQKNNVIFIGPTPYSIAKMGDKIQAKKIAQTAGVNIVPGDMCAIKSENEALAIAKKIGYPIMLKAAAGGGGKGIRIVHNAEEMQQAFSSTRNEAKNNFADARTFIEKYIEQPRHIEMQVLSDGKNIICLGERECSIQRHHQKVIEEAPSSFINEEIRQQMYTQSIALAREVDYVSAGTVEFIVDKMGNFYFMEMNTRLQVEHPITEMITGIDIVEQMIRIAQGEELKIKQEDIQLKGWATECRIYSEDPSCGFLPSIGRINTYLAPKSFDGLRIETSVCEGAEISMFYDAMIAKVCTWGENRLECINKMQKALSEYVIRGISNNISFLQTVLSSPRYLAGDISTNFLEEEYKNGFTGPLLSDEEGVVMLCSALFVNFAEYKRAYNITGQLRARSLSTRWVVMLDDKKYPVIVRNIEDGYKISFEHRRLYITSKWNLGSKIFQCIVNGKKYSLQIEYDGLCTRLTYLGHSVNTRILSPKAAELTKYMKKIENKKKPGELIANMPGLIRDIRVKKGDTVNENQTLLIVEAMKMENILTSECDGVIEEIFINIGDTVSTGDKLIKIKPNA